MPELKPKLDYNIIFLTQLGAKISTDLLKIMIPKDSAILSKLARYYLINVRRNATKLLQGLGSLDIKEFYDLSEDCCRRILAILQERERLVFSEPSNILLEVALSDFDKFFLTLSSPEYKDDMDGQNQLLQSYLNQSLFEFIVNPEKSFTLVSAAIKSIFPQMDTRAWSDPAYLYPHLVELLNDTDRKINFLLPDEAELPVTDDRYVFWIIANHLDMTDEEDDYFIDVKHLNDSALNKINERLLLQQYDDFFSEISGANIATIQDGFKSYVINYCKKFPGVGYLADKAKDEILATDKIMLGINKNFRILEREYAAYFQLKRTLHSIDNTLLSTTLKIIEINFSKIKFAHEDSLKKASEIRSCLDLSLSDEILTSAEVIVQFIEYRKCKKQCINDYTTIYNDYKKAEEDFQRALSHNDIEILEEKFNVLMDLANDDKKAKKIQALISLCNENVSNFKTIAENLNEIINNFAASVIHQVEKFAQSLDNKPGIDILLMQIKFDLAKYNCYSDGIKELHDASMNLIKENSILCYRLKQYLDPVANLPNQWPGFFSDDNLERTEEQEEFDLESNTLTELRAG